MEVTPAGNATNEKCDGMQLWMQIPVIFVQLFGIPANLLVFRAIGHIRLGSRLTMQLLRSQCLFDGLTCLCALTKVIRPGRWYTRSRVMNHILCRVWFTYTIYWLFVLLSLGNLVCTAFDRFNAVVFNVTYQKRQTIHRTICYVGTVTYAVSLVSLSPLLLEYNESEGRCLAYPHGRDPLRDTVIRIDSMCWPWLTYFIPCAIVVVLYGKLITLLRKPNLYMLTVRERNKALGRLEIKSKRHHHVAQSLTIATFSMQTLFLVTHGFDRIYYFVGVNGWIEYRVGSVPHLLGLWAITLNSCINPTALIFTMKPLQIWLLRFAGRIRRNMRQNHNSIQDVVIPMQTFPQRLYTSAEMVNASHRIVP